MKQDLTKEIEFFDRCNQTRGYDVLTQYGYSRIIDNLRKFFDNRLEGAKILDLGCGSGAFTRQVATTAQTTLFGVDISLQAILIAQDKNDGIHYCISDLAQLGIKKESFDVVIFSGVLHHFPDVGPCLSEGFRILKKGGGFFSFDPHLNNPFMWLYRHPHSPFYSKCGKTNNEQLLSADQMNKALTEAGFCRIKVYPISGVTFKYLPSRIGRFLLPAYNTIEFLLGFSPWANKIGSFLICCGEKESD